MRLITGYIVIKLDIQVFDDTMSDEDVVDTISSDANYTVDYLSTMADLIETEIIGASVLCPL